LVAGGARDFATSATLENGRLEATAAPGPCDALADDVFAQPNVGVEKTRDRAISVTQLADTLTLKAKRTSPPARVLTGRLEAGDRLVVVA
jgi:hypothetical protein